MYGKTQLRYILCYPATNCLANNNYCRKQVRTHKLEFTDLGQRGANLNTLQNHAYQHRISTSQILRLLPATKQYFKLIKRKFKAVKSDEMCVS